MGKCKRVTFAVTLMCCIVIVHSVASHPAAEHLDEFTGRRLVMHDQNTLEDWSIMCTRNVLLSNFLTLGMGYSDVLTVFISAMSQMLPNCTIELTTSKGAYVIVTIEFPDNLYARKVLNCNRTRIVVSAGNDPDYDACKKANLRSHRYLSSVATAHNKVLVRISGQGYFDTTKVTATTARRVKGDKCDDSLEVKCERIDHEIFGTYCLTMDVACDGHFNCGFKNKFDEAETICTPHYRTYYMILVLIVVAIIAVIVFFFFRLLRVKIPRVGTNFFVFNEDEDNRLNLASVFANPLANQPAAKQSVTSHSSSYYFRTTPIPQLPEDQLEGKRSRSKHPSEVELRSVPLRPIRSRPLPPRPHTDEPRPTATPFKEESSPARETSPEEAEDHRKKTHFHIAPAQVEIIPPFTTELLPHRGLQEEQPQKSILGHTHDNKPFPRYKEDAGPSKPIQKEKKRKKNSLSKVRSSKDLIIKKIHAHGHSDDDGRPPVGALRPPDSDSD